MQIYINKNGKQLGPFDEATVRQMLKIGQLSEADFGIKQGQQNWQKLGEMFPAPPPIPNPAAMKTPVQYDQPINNPSANPTPKSGSSKGLLFGLLGCGGLIVLSVIGLAVFAFLTNRKTDTSIGNQTNSPVNVNRDTTAKDAPPKDSAPKDYKALQNKAEELAKLTPPQKLETNPMIKGKVAIVQKDRDYEAKILGIDYAGEKLNSMDVDRYGFAINRLAQSPAEIDTLIQLSCKKGGALGTYDSGTVAYANICKATVIDYKAPAIIAQKTFTNSTPPLKIKAGSSDKEYVLLSPDDYDEFVSGLPMDKLKEPLVEMPFEDSTGTYGKYKSFLELASELFRVSAPEALSPDATLKGKICVVLRDRSSKAEIKGIDGLGKEFYKYDYENWGFGPERLAEKVSEIETLVRIDCRKGKKLGAQGRINVFANKCEVSVVDYKSFQTIAKKSFENNEMQKDIDKEVYHSQYTVLAPSDEINQYIKSFVK